MTQADRQYANARYSGSFVHRHSINRNTLVCAICCCCFFIASRGVCVLYYGVMVNPRVRAPCCGGGNIVLRSRIYYTWGTKERKRRKFLGILHFSRVKKNRRRTLRSSQPGLLRIIYAPSALQLLSCKLTLSFRKHARTHRGKRKKENKERAIRSPRIMLTALSRSITTKRQRWLPVPCADLESERAILAWRRVASRCETAAPHSLLCNAAAGEGEEQNKQSSSCCCTAAAARGIPLLENAFAPRRKDKRTTVAVYIGTSQERRKALSCFKS